jgi:hypothetical protein
MNLNILKKKIQRCLNVINNDQVAGPPSDDPSADDGD